jgi:hypothetical protein
VDGYSLHASIERVSHSLPKETLKFSGLAHSHAARNDADGVLPSRRNAGERLIGDTFGSVCSDS